MAPQDDQPTRQRILEAARRLFHEQGFHATGVSTILREAGVNSGSLYHYFPSKDALLVGVLEWYTELLRPMVMDPVEQAAMDPVNRVFALLEQYRQGLVALEFKLGCPIGNIALEIADDNPDARRLVDLNFRNWMGVVRGWLDAAGDRLPLSTDRGQLASLVLTVMEGGMMQARAARTIEPYDAAVAQLRAYMDLLHSQAAKERTKGAGGLGGTHEVGV